MHEAAPLGTVLEAGLGLRGQAGLFPEPEATLGQLPLPRFPVVPSQLSVGAQSCLLLTQDSQGSRDGSSAGRPHMSQGEGLPPLESFA